MVQRWNRGSYFCLIVAISRGEFYSQGTYVLLIYTHLHIDTHKNRLKKIIYVYEKRPLKAECSVPPLADFLGAACRASGRSVRCSVLGDLFQLAWQSTVKLWFLSAEWLCWQEMRFMNADDIWLEPTIRLFCLHCRRRLRVVCQQCSSPSPLCTTGSGESPSVCLGLTLETFGAEIAPSSPNTSNNKYRQTLGEGVSTQ